MTGNEARQNLMSMASAVNGIAQTLVGVDQTPNNQDLQSEASDAAQGILDAYAAIGDGQNSLGSTERASYNAALVKYKVIASTFSEFGSDSFPTFGKALQESVNELPDTLKSAGAYVGDTVGGAVQGVTSFTFEAVKKIVGDFFKGFGWFGWLVVFLALVTLAFWYIPGLRGKALGVIGVK